ncbi:hypothetical protein M758_9G053600 [Ceratodon purpureus]|nr:hypothetical protein M758_9G053600 [Ceratodon purpureus]
MSQFSLLQKLFTFSSSPSHIMVVSPRNRDLEKPSHHSGGDDDIFAKDGPYIGGSVDILERGYQPLRRRGRSQGRDRGALL